MNASCLVRFSRHVPVMIAAIFMMALAAYPLHARVQVGDFFVAPTGDDTHSGRSAVPTPGGKDGPFATLARAQQAARQTLKAQPARTTPIVIVIRGGFYSLEEPIRFTPEDSGRAAAPVIYQAHEGEQPIFSAGRLLSGFVVGKDGRWRLTIPQVKEGTWSFSQLFIADQRKPRARLPRTGYYMIEKAMPPTPANAARGHDRFIYPAGAIDPGWPDRQAAEVVIFHQWSTSRMKIASIDPAQRAVTFTGSTRSTQHWGSFPAGHRFFIENVVAGLTEPGQWLLSGADGLLTYIPMPGQKPNTVSVIAPRLPQILLIDGEAERMKFVENLEFRGLTFAHTNWVCPPQGSSHPQAEIGVPAAVAIKGGRNILFNGCTLRHLGGYAMEFAAGSRDCIVRESAMLDLGAGGVKIGSPGGGVSHITLENNTLAHGGRMHPAAVGVLIGQSSHNRILHNDIFDFYYTAVSIGWSWGYAHSTAHHNEVAFNHMHTIGRGVLSDMGAVYTLGLSPGTSVHHNRIHDVNSFGYGGWGLYTDEGSTDIHMHSNLVYRTKTGSFHQHYGKDNRIENNILVDSREHQLQRTRAEAHNSFFLTGNIVYYKTGPLLGSNWKDDRFTLDRNLYFNAAGKPVLFPGDLTLEQWRAQRKHDLNSIVADPLFVDVAGDDYRLKPDSPAFKIGFKPWDHSMMGRTTPCPQLKAIPPVPATYE